MKRAPGPARRYAAALMSYLSLHYHIVFATKGRYPFITTEWRNRLHDYLGGCVRGLGGVSERVGGVADHVHMLASLSATKSIADVVRDVKSNSSGWVHDELQIPKFGWQDGYAAFTVSASTVETVARYIDAQEEHHRKRSFREELQILLRKHSVPYDPKYLP